MVPAPPDESQWRLLAWSAELRRPHLVLADVGGRRSRRASVSSSSRSSTCCARRPPFFGVLERELLAPAVALREPRGGVAAGSTSGSRSSITSRASPTKRHVGADHLVELGRIDVDVDLHRVRAELVDSLPVMRSSQRAPIAMIRSQCDRPPCWRRRCRACPACPGAAGGFRRHRALAEQRVHHGRLQLLGELR